MNPLMFTVPVRETGSNSMLCIRPYRPRPGIEYGCGQCTPCRINRRRMWTCRLVLEAAAYARPSSFITLTYRPADLPRKSSVVPAHVEEFRYKLRYLVGAFRYYFVGEYGERSERPHYHGLLFGLRPSDTEISRCWQYGSFHVGDFTVSSGGYCAGYVTKKMTSKEDFRLNGRHPEFTRMSRRPGIGVPGVEGIIKWLYSSEGAKYLQRNHDVPKAVRFDGKLFPLGRYLVERIRNELGVASADPVRSLHAEALRLDRCVPEVAAARECKREGHYQRAKFFLNQRKSKGII